MYSRVVAVALICILITASTARADGADQPDPAKIALTEQDLPEWTQTDGMREEIWSSAPGPMQPTGLGDVYAFESDFTRTGSDGQQQLLTTRAVEGKPSVLAERFSELQHNALGQKRIVLPPIGDQSVAWWEGDGPTRRAAAAARLGNEIVELHLTGDASSEVSDDQISTWMARLVERRLEAPPEPLVDWTQLLPDAREPWSFVLDSAHVGEDWQQQNGLDLVSHEMGGQVLSVSASRSFDHTGVLRRSLSSMATVYPSDSAASDEGMSGPGQTIAAPELGEQAKAYRQTDPSSNEAPEVTYTILVRHGPMVTGTQEHGIAWTLDSPDETVTLAKSADAIVSAADHT